MLFNSIQFLFAFLPISLSIFILLGSLEYRTLAIGSLAIASLTFYGWDDPFRLLPLILFSIIFNFTIGWLLMRHQSRRVLPIGVCGDLLLLGYFKYAGFVAGTITAVTSIVVPDPKVVLPIGISFFTFTQIAFLVDAFRGSAREYKPLHYLLFV